MATLTSKQRKALPANDFAGPNRTYPDQDRAHAINAEARAKQQMNRGAISKDQFDAIHAKAQAKIKASK